MNQTGVGETGRRRHASRNDESAEAVTAADATGAARPDVRARQKTPGGLETDWIPADRVRMRGTAYRTDCSLS
jgi:hypothetical protein